MNNLVEYSSNQHPVYYAYNLVKNRIVSGEYQPSQTLVESHLAKEIGVSISNLKNALLLLEHEKLIELEKNRGANVKAYQLDDIINYLEIREALEIVLIRTAIRNATEESFVQLETIVQQMKDAIATNNLQLYSELNIQFHETIYSASTNQEAVEMVKSIKAKLKRYQIRTVILPNRAITSLNEHIDIYKTFALKNEEQAAIAMADHMGNIKQSFINYFKYII